MLNDLLLELKNKISNTDRLIKLPIVGNSLLKLHKQPKATETVKFVFKHTFD